jgi:hypothetical protein
MADTLLGADSGLTNHKTDPSRDSFFNGYVGHGANSKDPFVGGFAFIKWIKIPTFMERLDSQAARDFKLLSEKNFKGFSGLSDLQMDTGAITAGFTNNELSHAKGTVQKPEGFTLKYQVKSGSDLDMFYRSWVGGVRDPKTGIATYPRQTGLPYHSDNHTGILLYVVTRPDADNFGKGADGSNIEFAALYTNVLPTKINLDHFNFESGSHEFAEKEQEFKGMMHFGPAVDKFAIANMDAKKIYTFYNEPDFTNLSEFAQSIPSA